VGPDRQELALLGIIGMTTQVAIVVAALIIAVVLAFTTRWEISGDHPGAIRLDRWTGSVYTCTSISTQSGRLPCEFN
jgi:hypothetical protein